MIGDISLSNILTPVPIAVAVASRGFRVDEDYMACWAHWFNLALTREKKPAVRHYLQWGRRARTAGGLAGFLGRQSTLKLPSDTSLMTWAGGR